MQLRAVVIVSAFAVATPRSGSRRAAKGALRKAVVCQVRRRHYILH
jgi:hypothetical protein